MRETLQKGIYEVDSASRVQRFTLALLVLVWVAMVWWMLFAGGLEAVGRLLGWTWHPGDLLRRACIAAALSIYCVRLMFTWFGFLKRGIQWQEVGAVAPWLLCIFLVMAIEGGRNSAPFGIGGAFGVALFCGGSWLNTYAEYARRCGSRLLRTVGCCISRGRFGTRGIQIILATWLRIRDFACWRERGRPA